MKLLLLTVAVTLTCTQAVTSSLLSRDERQLLEKALDMLERKLDDSPAKKSTKGAMFENVMQHSHRVAESENKKREDDPPADLCNGSCDAETETCVKIHAGYDSSAYRGHCACKKGLVHVDGACVEPMPIEDAPTGPPPPPPTPEADVERKQLLLKSLMAHIKRAKTANKKREDDPPADLCNGSCDAETETCVKIHAGYDSSAYRGHCACNQGLVHVNGACVEPMEDAPTGPPPPPPTPEVEVDRKQLLRRLLVELLKREEKKTISMNL